MDLGGSIRRRRKGAARTRAKGKQRPAGRKPRKQRSPRKRTGARTGAARVRLGGIAMHPGIAALAVAGAGLGLGYLVAVTLMFPVPDTPVEVQVVPDLRGQPVMLALSELADSGLVVGRVDSLRHPLVPAGTVMGQSPLPGPTALVNAPVRVTVSSART
ncbi:MAG: PASTA domain-containing protein, partial [Gemmatimonadetes bacterium]|nr:PASTA domain-containing protein [Gemmatimonadota bacterium]